MFKRALFLVCLVSVNLFSADNKNKVAFDLKLVMSVDCSTVKIPLGDNFETISTFIQQYKDNDAHPLAKVMTYALRDGVMHQVGRIPQLQGSSLESLPRQKMLFVSYVNEQEKPMYALCAGTSTVKDVNLLRKFIESEYKKADCEKCSELDELLRFMLFAELLKDFSRKD